MRKGLDGYGIEIQKGTLIKLQAGVDARAKARKLGRCSMILPSGACRVFYRATGVGQDGHTATGHVTYKKGTYELV